MTLKDNGKKKKHVFKIFKYDIICNKNKNIKTFLFPIVGPRQAPDTILRV